VGVRATGPGKGRVGMGGRGGERGRGWGRSNPGTGTRLQGGPHPRRNSASRCVWVSRERRRGERGRAEKRSRSKQRRGRVEDQDFNGHQRLQDRNGKDVEEKHGSGEGGRGGVWGDGKERGGSGIFLRRGGVGGESEGGVGVGLGEMAGMGRGKGMIRRIG